MSPGSAWLWLKPSSSSTSFHPSLRAPALMDCARAAGVYAYVYVIYLFDEHLLAQSVYPMKGKGRLALPNTIDS